MEVAYQARTGDAIASWNFSTDEELLKYASLIPQSSTHTTNSLTTMDLLAESDEATCQ